MCVAQEPSEVQMTQKKRGLGARLVDAAEEWIYRLNERDHWVFGIYDRFNELHASLFMRGVRARGSRLDRTVECSDGSAALVRFLTPDDEEALAALLDSLAARYLPPHARDRDTARRALRRRSYLPFGIFIGDRIVGYLLLRLFFPWRVVTGIWTLPDTHNLGLAQVCLRQTCDFARGEKLANYCTIPIDNHNSLRVALGVGWRQLRTNRRFHVLLMPE
jgi:GNAT superfamily N-acetyltransferase